MSTFFSAILSNQYISLDLKGYEHSKIKAGIILYNSNCEQSYFIISAEGKPDLIYRYDLNRKSLLDINNTEYHQIIQYLESLYLDQKNDEIKKQLEALKNIKICNHEMRGITDTYIPSNYFIYINEQKIKLNSFSCYITRDFELYKISFEKSLVHNRLTFLDDEFNLEIEGESLFRTKLICLKFMVKELVEMYCTNSIYYKLSTIKNDYVYIEEPKDIESVNIMHFLLRNVGIDEQYINIPSELYADKEIAYKVILLVQNLTMDEILSYSYITLYPFSTSNYEIKKLKQEFTKAKYRCNNCCFAEIILNAKSLYEAYTKATELLIKTIQVIKIVLRDNLLTGENINFWSRYSEQWGVEVGKWAYIEAIPYNQVVIGNLDNIHLYNVMHIGKYERDKLLNDIITWTALLDKNMPSDNMNLVRAAKWVNKSWNTDDLEDKVLYTIIALEFLITNIKDSPLLKKSEVNKIKRYISQELSGEITADLKNEAKSKISHALNTSPMMYKLQKLLEDLEIFLESYDMDVIKKVRRIRNDIAHGRDYTEIYCQDINKVNSIITLIINKSLKGDKR